MDLEEHYYKLITEKLNLRNSLLYKRYGNNFLEEYSKPNQREWYKKNVAPVDAEIVKYVNLVAPILLIDKQFNKIADVFKDEEISAWFYMKKFKENQNIEK